MFSVNNTQLREQRAKQYDKNQTWAGGNRIGLISVWRLMGMVGLLVTVRGQVPTEELSDIQNKTPIEVAGT